MRQPIGAVGLVAIACGLGLSALPAAAAAAARGGPDTANVPAVYGGGILMAFSGLDGITSAAAPCTAVTIADGVGLKFHLPKDPVLRIRLPGAGETAVRWRLVSNDLLVGKVGDDPQPLVVGFASANVVVGRLPTGARVTLEGGDTSVVLQRGESSDRTHFAMAYDPKGGKGAPAAAATALKVSIDTLVESRLDFFKSVPRLPDGVPPAEALALAKAWSVMKVNVYSPEPPIPGRWTTPARWPLRYMGLWDSAFHSVGLMHLDVRLAKDALEAVYGFQDEAGFIPSRMGPGQTSEVAQPPLLAWAAWQVYTEDKMGDRAFLQKTFDVAQKQVVWFMKNRRMDGEPPPTQPLEYGTPLYAWKTPEESGAENSPRFDAGAQVAAVDLSCYLANACWTLQTMAQRLGYRELAKTWGQRGDAIAEAARKTFWDGERGFFFDRKGPGGEWVSVWSAAGLLPLWAGVASPDQAARLKDHLVSKKFWTPAPVPSVARDDPGFKKDMWRGPVWMSVNYLLVRGLQRYGFEKEAADLRARTLETVAKWYGRTGALWEFYDGDDQMPPAGLGRKVAAGAGPTVAADYHGTAALYADLLLRPKP